MVPASDSPASSERLTIRDIASTTKISAAALNAIEHNEFARLPGGVFRRAYVRAFATEVGLDADELVREYRARFEMEIAAGPVACSINGAPGRPLGRSGEVVEVRISDENPGSLSAEPANAIPTKGAATPTRSGSVGRGVAAPGQPAVTA